MTKFSDLALDPRVLQAVADAGYETPTPIQAQAIPHALQGRDVLGIARIAGIQAAKKTSDLIPLCHPLALTRVAIEFEAASARQPGACGIFCAATVETVGPTGVEMEALTAVQVALLTIYDMCKAADRGMSIHDVRVLEKHGGKSGSFTAP